MLVPMPSLIRSCADVQTYSIVCYKTFALFRPSDARSTTYGRLFVPAISAMRAIIVKESIYLYITEAVEQSSIGRYPLVTIEEQL